MIDKKKRLEKGEDKKVKVAKSFGNCLQAFAILTGVLSTKYPQLGPAHFVYLTLFL